MRVECDVTSRHLTITEHRPPWREDFGPDWISFPIARLRYTATTKTWTLYWRDRHQRFHRYDLLNPQPTSTTCSPKSTKTPPAPSGAELPGPGRGQIRPSYRGQFKLTLPAV